MRLPTVRAPGYAVRFATHAQLQPVVPPQVVHLRHVPLRTMVKLPHSGQASPSKPLSFASRAKPKAEEDASPTATPTTAAWAFDAKATAGPSVSSLGRKPAAIASSAIATLPAVRPFKM